MRATCLPNQQRYLFEKLLTFHAIPTLRAGANINLKDLGPIELGKARRTGTVAGSVDDDAATAAAAAAAGAAAGAAVGGNGAPGLAYAAAPMDASASGEGWAGRLGIVKLLGGQLLASRS